MSPSPSLMPIASQLAAADRVLGEESALRTHVVVSLSGAHAYGFPSPDSDLDLKGIHVERTARLVGLSPPPLHATRMQVIDGVEIDYSSNELGPVLASILGGNGNYAERVLGPIALRRSPLLDELAPLINDALSTRLYRHYNGFARGQLADFDDAPLPTAKKILYVLRTALTGIHVLRSGQIATDINELLPLYGFGEAQELVAAKRVGERVVLDQPLRERWRHEVGRALSLLDEAHAHSPLPSEPRNREALESWLHDVRRRHF